MSNFSFLRNKPEFSSFAQHCIHAEELYKDSPNSCVTTSRAALESIVKWLYKHDYRLQRAKTQGQDLFSSMENDVFKRLFSAELLTQMHKIRMMANDVLHHHHQVPNEQALFCLRALFNLVQWVDRKYGQNYVPQQFNKDDVPENMSMIKKALTYTAAAAIGGVVINTVKDMFLNDRKY